MNPIIVTNARKVICTNVDAGKYDCTVTGDIVEKKTVSNIHVENGIVSSDPNTIDTPVQVGKMGVAIYFKSDSAKCIVREDSITCKKQK